MDNVFSPTFPSRKNESDFYVKKRVLLLIYEELDEIDKRISKVLKKCQNKITIPIVIKIIKYYPELKPYSDSIELAYHFKKTKSQFIECIFRICETNKLKYPCDKFLIKNKILTKKTINDLRKKLALEKTEK